MPDTKTLVKDLKAQFNGRLITPADAGYDAARSLFYGGFDHRPAAIVRPADSRDISRTILLALERGLELAVRSGGHSSAGHSTTEGGLVLDLKNMKSIQIDPLQRTAWAEAGLTAAEYTAAAAAHGLATGFGDTGSVGIGGITLGGGIGFLARKYGLTIDDLLAAEVVTAGGELLHTDAEHHPDLFWAIRGGGGNFGVAARFMFRLHPLERVLGGMLVLPATVEVITGFAREAAAAPEELSTIANVMTAPPMPFLPPELHGQLILLAFMVYAGDPQAGERAVAPFRSLAAPLADMLQPMAYTDMYQPEDESYHPKAVSRSQFIDHIEPTTAETILTFLNKSDAPFRVAHFRVLGGAVSRVPPGETAFAHRQAPILMNMAAFYDTPGEREVRSVWADEFAAGLKQEESGAYVNFMGDEGPGWIHRAYPGPVYTRLAAVKSRYDPGNFFHHNHNIRPA